MVTMNTRLAEASHTAEAQNTKMPHAQMLHRRDNPACPDAEASRLLRPNDQVERCAALTPAQKVAAYRRIRANAMLGHIGSGAGRKVGCVRDSSIEHCFPECPLAFWSNCLPFE